MQIRKWEKSATPTKEFVVYVVVIKWERTSGAGVDRWTCKTAEYCAFYEDHIGMVEWTLLRCNAATDATLLFYPLLRTAEARDGRDVISIPL